jgi:hypothetical protein
MVKDLSVSPSPGLSRFVKWREAAAGPPTNVSSHFHLPSGSFHWVLSTQPGEMLRVPTRVRFACNGVACKELLDQPLAPKDDHNASIVPASSIILLPAFNLHGVKTAGK